MALLGTIRNRFGWLMSGLIFLGVAAFLFMDASGPNSGMGGSSSKVGSVNGEKITRDEIQKYSQNMQGRGMLSEEIDAQVWQQVVTEKILNQKAEEAGLAVTADEMGELFLSPDPRIQSQLVRQQFMDRQTGQVNTDQIRQVLNMFKSKSALRQQYQGEQLQQMLEQYDTWKDLEKSVKQQRLQSKYFNALDAGFFTPNWLTNLEHKTRNTAYNFDYVSIPYSAINGEGEVTDEEMKKYIAAHPRQYKREASANIDYVLFDVIPTSKDSSDYIDEMKNVAEEFKTLGDDSLVVAKYDGEFPIDYLTKEEMKEPQAIIDSLFAAEKGAIIGPYGHQKQYRVIKAYDRKIMPDSVRARHILYKAKTQEEGQKGRKLLDSLKKVLQTDPTASFDSLAMKFSQDGSAAKGGDLGWKAKDGGFVPPFENYMFYTGEKDSLGIIYTQFGVHLIQITANKYETNKEAIRVATVSQDIIPSEETTTRVKSKVNDFMLASRTIDDMKAAAKEQGLQAGSASGLEKGDYEIPGVGKNSAAAELIYWAHKDETNVGDVSNTLLGIEDPKLNYTKQFVVAGLTAKSVEGLASLSDPTVKAEVDRILRNEKKAAVVNKKLSELNSLDAVASTYGVSKKTASGFKYGEAQIADAGVEPKVAGVAANTAAGKLSKAIDGNEGVYVLQPIGKIDPPEITDLKKTRQDITQKISQAVSGKLFEDMKENADIVDKRERF